jgi:hypothetical protein
MMAGVKARMDVIEKSLNYDDQENNRSQLKNPNAIVSTNAADIDTNHLPTSIPKQSLTKDKFAARYHDPTFIDIQSYGSR